MTENAPAPVGPEQSGQPFGSPGAPQQASGAPNYGPTAGGAPNYEPTAGGAASYGPPTGSGPGYGPAAYGPGGYGPAPVGLPQPSAKKPFYKRRWFLITVPVLVVLIVLGAIFGSQSSSYQLTSALKDTLAKEPGVTTVDQVSCPSSVDTSKGHSYVCQATINGKPENLTTTFDADRHFIVTNAAPAGAPTAPNAAAPPAGTTAAKTVADACRQLLPTIKSAQAPGADGSQIADQLTSAVQGIDNPELSGAATGLASQFRSLQNGGSEDQTAIRNNGVTIGRICALNGVTP